MRSFRSRWPCWTQYRGSGRSGARGNIERRRRRQYDLGLGLGCRRSWIWAPRRAAATRRQRPSAPAPAGRSAPPSAPAFEWQRRSLRHGSSGITAAMAGGIAGCVRRRGIGRGDLLLFDALVLGALPFDAALPACGAVRANGAACFAARGGPTGSTRSNSASTGTATVVSRSLVAPGRQRPVRPVHIGLAGAVAGCPSI